MAPAKERPQSFDAILNKALLLVVVAFLSRAVEPKMVEDASADVRADIAALKKELKGDIAGVKALIADERAAADEHAAAADARFKKIETRLARAGK